jgi:polysaccharide biosynthesis protein PslH
VKLLFIALRSPFSSHSGNSLILRNHLRHLHGRHEIDLIASGDAADAEQPDLQRWCRRVLMAPVPGPAERRIAQATGLIRGRPIRVSSYANADFERTVRRLIADQRYDAVVVQLCEAAQYLPAPPCPSVMDFEDPPLIKLTRTIPWLTGASRRAASVDLRLIGRYEGHVAKAFDRLVFVSHTDAQEFGVAHGCLDRVASVHHAVEFRDDAPGFEARRGHAMVVTGNMAHPPNVAAVNFLCSQVFPLVRRTVSDAELWLVGADPVAEVRDWARVDGITVTGAVPDVGAYLSRARVALCGVPVVVGTQTKVLEALAAGTPVVTTAAGNHGIHAESGRHLYVADSPTQFATRAVSLLRGERWTDIAEAGRRLLQDSFSPAGAAAELERVIAGAIESYRSRL